MITNITLENFKCFRRVELNPKRLTVLIGPNGTGKSSVLQALLIKKQSRGSSNHTYKGKSINLCSQSDIAPKFLDDPGRETIEFEVSNPDFMLSEYTRIHETMRFVPAARGLVQPTYPLGDSLAESITLQQGLDAQETQLATNLVYDGTSAEKLSNLLMKVTGTGLRAETVPPRAVEVKSLTSSGKVNIVLEGFGTNALIQLLLELITAPRGATVLIEEPEIHLHPKAQAELAEVMANTAKAEYKQVIMTTHSEYVAGRLLTLVAEGKLTTDELAIYAFDKDEKGECFATEIEVTERGQTKGGLYSFDEATRDEMRRYADGLRKHV